MTPGTAAERIEKYQFDDFELFPKQGVLKRAGLRIPLTPTPLRALVLLVESAGETVSKEDLFARVWNGARVEENNLARTILTLRKALEEKRGENRYIVTDPGRGYRFVAPVARVIEGGVKSNGIHSPESTTEELTHPSGLSRSPKSLRLVALAVLPVLTLAVGLWMYRITVQPPARPSIAVLPVRNLSNGSAESWLQTALPEMLTSELASGGKLLVVPAEDVARWRADFDRGAGIATEETILRSARKNLPADTYVVGSYIVTGVCPDCRIRVDLSLLKARTGERMATIIDECPGAQLLDLTARMGHKLRAQLGLGNNAVSSPRWQAAGTMKEYVQGLAALRRGDPIDARQHLEDAGAADGQNPLIHSALSDTWMALGYGTRATDEIRRAYDLAGPLDRTDGLGIEARYRVSVKQWDRAIEIYQTIFRLFPDSLDDGLNLARTEVRAQRFAEANATLKELRRLPRPAGDDPRIDLIAAQAAGAQNDFERARTLAHSAAEEAKARGAQYLFARARLFEGGVLETMNSPKAFAVQDEARTICELIGDRDCVSKLWRLRGNNRYVAGDFQAAQEAYANGMAIARQLGNRAELSNLAEGLAVVARANREWQKAELNFLEAISLRAETGFDTTDVRNELAEFYVGIGRLDDAEKTLQAAVTEGERSGAHQDLGDSLLVQSQVARLRGQLTIARQFCARALAEERQTGNPTPLKVASAQLSSIDLAAGNPDQAEKELLEAGLGSFPEDQGAVELARAELSLAKGQFQSSAQAAEKAATAFDKGHLDDRAVQAFVTAADALDMANRNTEAAAACAEAGKRANLTPNPYAHALAQVCSWRTSSASGESIPSNVEKAIASLQSPELRLQLDFVRALKLQRSGLPASRGVIHKLAEDAGRSGYLTLSRRAAALGQ